MEESTTIGETLKWHTCYWQVFQLRWCYQCNDRFIRLCRGQLTWLAYHDFPTLLCSRCYFLRLRMVLTLLLPVRAIYGLHDLITQKHIDNICKITLATGSMVGYAYSMEFFIAWYGANPYEGFAFINRAFGNYWWSYWIMVSCNVICPQLFWFKKIRENTPLVWIISIFVNIGMWFERFVIANTTLSRDFLLELGYYSPTVVDIFTFFDTFGFSPYFSFFS